jgi:hypothetical protein
MRHPYKKSLKDTWKALYEMLCQSRPMQWSAAISLLLLAAMFALPAWRLVPLSDQSPFIALHYNVYLGVDRFGSLWRLFLLPLLGLLFLIANLSIQARFFRHQKTLALFFAGATPLLQFVLFVAMTLIVLINL